MKYKLNNEAKTKVEEFTEELKLVTALLEEVTSGNFGSKTKAREARNILTDIKKKITSIKRETIKLFEGK